MNDRYQNRNGCLPPEVNPSLPLMEAAEAPDQLSNTKQGWYRISVANIHKVFAHKKEVI